MLKEFRDFEIRGNVMDLAIGVIIAAAFGKIISSLIDDVITPLLLQPALDATGLKNIGELTAFGSVKYGLFLSSIIDFIIVSFVLFIIIRSINNMKKKVAQEAPAPTDIELLTEIRNLLKK